MAELAATGAEGIEMLALMLEPMAEGVNNSPVEYAVNGVASYVSKDGAAQRDGQGVHEPADEVAVGGIHAAHEVHHQQDAGHRSKGKLETDARCRKRVKDKYKCQSCRK